MASKFEVNSINKQDSAYKLSYAKRQFSYSCEKCCSQNLHRGDCSRCPVKEAHVRALQEIASGERKYLDPNYSGNVANSSLNKTVSINKNGKVTITLSIEFN